MLFLLLAVVLTSCQSCEKDTSLPSVTTSQISAITNNSVISGGNITDDGNAKIIACGLVYGPSANLTINDPKTSEIVALTFSSQISNLETGKQYYLRAYATNEVGTSYGEALSFQTSGAITSATTLDATNVEYTGATLNGSVTTDNNQTAISFIYGENENNLDKTISVNTPSKSATTYSAIANISNLSNNTTYYFAIKAVNNYGVSIGETKSFKTLAGLTDIDGNTYKVVKIGNQIWMAENLKVTHYNDGSEIPNVSDNDAWMNLTTGGYCDYNNDPQNSVIYGRLYNAFAVWTDKLAPAGWHVPSDAEWTKLFSFVNNDGGPLKESGFAHWKSPNTGATNSTGFTALPNGGRYSHTNGVGEFDYMNESATWWASNKDFSYLSWGLEKVINYNSATIFNDFLQFADGGYGVRLIKD